MKEWTGENTDAFAVMDRQTVRGFDTWAIDQMGIPSAVLMENAAKNAARIVLEYFSEQARSGVCIFCGAGNNGGDGFVIARHLYNHGFPVKIMLAAEPEKVKGDAKINFDICQKMGLSITLLDTASAELFREVEDAVAGCGLLVDALLGTGLQGDLKSQTALLISCVNSHNIPIVAVDIPSGLDCDKGVPLPVSIEAAATVTFVALKKGFVENSESRNATGRVFVADIGIVPTRFAQ